MDIDDEPKPQKKPRQRKERKGKDDNEAAKTSTKSDDGQRQDQSSIVAKKRGPPCGAVRPVIPANYCKQVDWSVQVIVRYDAGGGQQSEYDEDGEKVLLANAMAANWYAAR